MKTDLLPVPGAVLYYEVRGAGPVLLLVCGGVYDAAGYAPLAERLADRYTVVTYDRRGNSRSPLDRAGEPQRLDEHADDAARLLAAVGVSTEHPAYVFGNSSGGQIAVALTTRYPQLVRAAVIHEPPQFDLLPDRDHFAKMIDDVEAAFAADGPEAAQQVLAKGLDMGPGPTDEERVPGGSEAPAEPDAATLEMMERIGGNFVQFIGSEVPSFGRYRIDLDALRPHRHKLVPAVGSASAGEPPARAAVALGEAVGVEAVVFPGDHGGFGNQAEPFAEVLDTVLRAA
ncbi:alpha/beta fold hydrolase [Asanoa iriomotensis]|uniref:Hydrolase n=1 Tax=Asanoa iriomotensis TaxID=234613 RepID=A0ABQ4BZ00_9ACTN|nr:alpha/beta hydrolase [Asanoa iriomotensis]GIF55758.1 hydrolase [Asanoa iriomotensis]